MMSVESQGKDRVCVCVWIHIHFIQAWFVFPCLFTAADMYKN